MGFGIPSCGVVRSSEGRQDFFFEKKKQKTFNYFRQFHDAG
jgi:hypothetical protein